MELDAKIEAILFFKAEPVTFDYLAKLLKTDESEIKRAILTLRGKLEGRGVTLVEKDGEVMLRTARELSDLISLAQKEELSRGIGRAGLETLSIVLYRGPISRRDIDYIRGVNSTFILRSLLTRGLIERVENPKDERVFLYRPTFELLAHLGIRSREELPEFETVQKEFDESERNLTQAQEAELKNDESNN